MLARSEHHRLTPVAHPHSRELSLESGRSAPEGDRKPNRIRAIKGSWPEVCRDDITSTYGQNAASIQPRCTPGQSEEPISPVFSPSLLVARRSTLCAGGGGSPERDCWSTEEGGRSVDGGQIVALPHYRYDHLVKHKPRSPARPSQAFDTLTEAVLAIRAEVGSEIGDERVLWASGRPPVFPPSGRAMLVAPGEEDSLPPDLHELLPVRRIRDVIECAESLWLAPGSAFLVGAVNYCAAYPDDYPDPSDLICVDEMSKLCGELIPRPEEHPDPHGQFGDRVPVAPPARGTIAGKPPSRKAPAKRRRK